MKAIKKEEKKPCDHENVYPIAHFIVERKGINEVFLVCQCEECDGLIATMGEWVNES